MSCPHGVWHDENCDQCIALDAAYNCGHAAGKLEAQAAMAAVPDDVWEALQRLIENAASLGPASGEDARLVSSWRGQFVPAREATPK